MRTSHKHTQTFLVMITIIMYHATIVELLPRVTYVTETTGNISICDGYKI